VRKQNKKRPKSGHGTITVHSSRGRLRLVFTHKGERRYLYLGIPDTTPARGLAELIARRIETDIYSEQFDESLESYRPEKLKRVGLTVQEVLERFLLHKEAQNLNSKTLGRYQSLLRWILKSPIAGMKADCLGDRHVVNFARLLEKGELASGQRKRRLEEMKACWEWAISEQLVLGDRNPWAAQHKIIKVAPRQPPKPFTQAISDRLRLSPKSQ
jgi:integrase